MLKEAGYRTGVVGKWHLGLGAAQPRLERRDHARPARCRFRLLIHLSGHRRPRAVRVRGEPPRRQPGPERPDSRGLRPRRIAGEPTGAANPELLKMHPSHGHDMSIVNGISRIGYMTGGKSARWVDEDMADTITGKAVQFLEQNRARPFFLYFATHDIHVPRVPHARFVGKTGMGPRGDAIAELDWSIGRILDTLDRLKLTRDTLFIFSSDNGPVVDDGYRDQAVEKLGDHKPAGPLRGGKYSAYDGGTRVPFVVRWPGRSSPEFRRRHSARWTCWPAWPRWPGASCRKMPRPTASICCPCCSASRGKAGRTSWNMRRRSR